MSLIDVCSDSSMLSASIARSSALSERACSSMFLSKADMALNPGVTIVILLRFSPGAGNRYCCP